MNIQTYIILADENGNTKTIYAGHGVELVGMQLEDSFYNRENKKDFPIGRYKIITRHWDAFKDFITLTIVIQKIKE